MKKIKIYVLFISVLFGFIINKEVLAEDKLDNSDIIVLEAVNSKEILRPYNSISKEFIMSSTDLKTEEFIQEVENSKDNEPEPIIVSQVNLGDYTVTAYCGCEKCCGQWASNRSDGVKGAAGTILKNGYSCATSKIVPFGTRFYIEGYDEVEVSDRVANWVAQKYNNKIIDVYFDNHSDAVSFAKSVKNVYEVK